MRVCYLDGKHEACAQMVHQLNAAERAPADLFDECEIALSARHFLQDT
jgi:hypothetical protein